MNDKESYLVFAPQNRINLWHKLDPQNTDFTEKFISDSNRAQQMLEHLAPKICFIYDVTLEQDKINYKQLVRNSYYTWFLVETSNILSDQLIEEFEAICFKVKECYVTPDFINNLQANSVYLKKLTFEKVLLKKLEKENHDFRQNLLSNISHELRTPLNGIIGFASILVEDILSHEQRDSLDVIISSSNRLLKVVDNLLDHTDIAMSKITLIKSKCDLIEILYSCLQSSICLKEDKDIDFIFDVQVASLPIIGDPNKIRLIVDHLLSNAIKFTGSGEITLRCKPVLNDLACIEIIDSGCGIDEDAFKSLFQPFHQADGSITRKFGGTGLGLFIADKYCKLMGGEIIASNNDEEGSTFTTILPITLVAEPK
ncbi:HAMP domain-containing histidine kinase, partial [bacterium]|nr:HAMP domain-containing histidine kinase [bacterium]